MIISLVTLQAHAASQSPGGARRIPQPLIDRCLRGGRLPCRRRFRLQVGFGDLKPSLRAATEGTVLATKDSGNTKQRHCRNQIQLERKAKTRPNTVEAQCKGRASATQTKVEARRKGTVSVKEIAGTASSKAPDHLNQPRDHRRLPAPVPQPKQPAAVEKATESSRISGGKGRGWAVDCQWKAVERQRKGKERQWIGSERTMRRTGSGQDTKRQWTGQDSHWRGSER